MAPPPSNDPVLTTEHVMALYGVTAPVARRFMRDAGGAFKVGRSFQVRESVLRAHEAALAAEAAVQTAHAPRRAPRGRTGPQKPLNGWDNQRLPKDFRDIGT